MPPSQLDLFSKQASLYSRYRPTYPSELFDFLANLTPGHSRAWDVGTGNGQAAVEITKRYESVIATDLSEGQLSFAQKAPGVTYALTAPNMTPEEVEQIVGPPGSVDLVTVAQALHWFDFDSFYGHVKRVLRRPGGAFACWGYGMCRISPAVDPVINRWYETTLPYWEPQREYVENSYRTIPFDFTPIPGKEELGTGPVLFDTTLEFTMLDMIGYFGSWSPVQTAKERGINLLSDSFRAELAEAWGSPEDTKVVTWPVFVRIGTLPPNE